MARKGVAILREIAIVKGADIDEPIREKMLAELNAELAEAYGQKALDLHGGDARKETIASKAASK